MLDPDDLCRYACFSTACDSSELTKDEVDKVIEDDLTQKLSEDLLQSIERKFQVDLQRRHRTHSGQPSGVAEYARPDEAARRGNRYLHQYYERMRLDHQCYYQLATDKKTIKSSSDLNILQTVEMYDRLLFILMQNQETRRSSQLTAPIESSKIKIRNKPISRQDVSLRREDDRTEPRTSGRNDRDDVERSEYDNNIPDTDCPACVEKGLTCIGRCPAERSKRE
ncbi:hypothetical protein RR48_11477 [Papilio machaon]|uniref:Uncharacterized protein n=1 Tax=Papilio machaon TaxID=76193 RepID=A0A194QN78_PAPMA|nr:hypothetical protein RR48_11477 [Papilio machaon]